MLCRWIRHGVGSHDFGGGPPFATLVGMPQIKNPEPTGPKGNEKNAEHEIRRAYNCAVESAVTWSLIGQQVSEINPDEVQNLYRKAWNFHRKEENLLAERWARTAQHLARAFWHEVKIAWLLKYPISLPYLEGATREELNLHEYSDTTEDLLNSLARHVPPGMNEMPEDMKHYLLRARKHLAEIGGSTHELLRAERIKAAHEYARVLECLALAWSAELKTSKVA